LLWVLWALADLAHSFGDGVADLKASNGFTSARLDGILITQDRQ
jgi:hypothetical protein